MHTHSTRNELRSMCQQGKCQINVFDLLTQVGLFPLLSCIERAGSREKVKSSTYEFNFSMCEPS